jgi:hypothetical protein
MPDDIYTRAGDALWRTAPDRVLVRQIGHEGVDLLGAAAMVWIALDTPRPMAELEREIQSLFGEPVDVRAAVDVLVSNHLVELSQGLPAAGRSAR